ncbi:MAG TPA: hypothetical protein VFU15_05545 [Bacteroidia bacterium]|nr:hypothetical protein [Bacteroidia bacterium]
MKKLIVTFLLLASASFAFAQDTAKKEKPAPQKSPEDRAAHFANHLQKDLGLTDDQKTKVHDLALAKEQKMDALRQQHQGDDPKSWSADRKKVHDDFITGMKGVLTPDQYNKWEAEKKQHQQQHQQQRPHHKPGADSTQGK